MPLLPVKRDRRQTSASEPVQGRRRSEQIVENRLDAPIELAVLEGVRKIGHRAPWRRLEANEAPAPSSRDARDLEIEERPDVRTRVALQRAEMCHLGLPKT